MAAFFALPLRDVLLQGFDGAFVQGLTWGLFDTRQTFRVCSRAAGSFRDVHPAIALDAWSAYPMPKWPRAPQADVDCSSPLSFGLKFTLSPEARFNVELQTWLARVPPLIVNATARPPQLLDAQKALLTHMRAGSGEGGVGKP